MSDDATTQAKPARRNSSAEADILAATEFEHLPDMFAMRNDDGSIVQEREPCYLIRADCFLGSGREATLYEESSIVVTGAVPNMQMEPLNRAAAMSYVKWLRRLPEHRAPIDVGDMSEAAQMLAADPEVLRLNKVQWQSAVVKLATELKLRREGLEAKDLPPIGHNFVRGPRTQAPPILGAKLAEMSQRLPGETRFAAAVPAFAPGPVTRRAGPQPMNMPNGR
jgi:hypothetical protein